MVKILSTGFNEYRCIPAVCRDVFFDFDLKYELHISVL